MILAISRFRVANGLADQVTAAFLDRPRLVDTAPGFLGMETFTEVHDPALFYLVTRWTDHASFQTWHGSPAHHQSHRGIPKGLKLDASYTQVVALTRLVPVEPSHTLEEFTADAAPLLARYLARTEALYVIAADGEGTIRACSQAVAGRLRQATAALIGQPIWPLLTASDAATLQFRVQTVVRAPDARLKLNFLDWQGYPYTLECMVDAQPGGFLIAGEPPARQDESFIEQMVELNGEMAVLSRENARQSRSLSRANAQLEREMAERARAEQARALAEEEVRALNARLEARVLERTAQLESAMNSLQAEVAERRLAQEAAQRAREDAELANAAKSVFLSRMSHELHTPLNAILGFAQLIEGGTLDAKSTVQAGHIVAAGRRLLQLVDGVLDIAQLEEGRLPLVSAPLDPALLVTTVLAPLRERAAARHITISDEVARAGLFLRVLADPDRLGQVLAHLLENAIAFNREGGQVTVSAASQPDGRLRLLVRDSGPGLRPDQVAKLFMPFERLDAEQRGIGGPGIGLVLAKRLMTAMGGTIGAESVVGQGSTFWVELPLAEDGPISAPERAASDRLMSEVPAPQPRVLYVAATLANTALMANLVRRAGAILLTATSGQEALARALEQQPALILLALPLPDMSAEELLRQVGDDARMRGTPVAVLSAVATPEQEARLRAAGVTTRLALPIQVAEFRSLLETVLVPYKQPHAAPGHALPVVTPKASPTKLEPLPPQRN